MFVPHLGHPIEISFTDVFPTTIKHKSKEQHITIADFVSVGRWGGVRAVSFIPIQRANLIIRGEGNSN